MKLFSIVGKLLLLLHRENMNRSKKLQLAVLCGGQSAEHEISLISAKNIISALDPEKYDIHVVLIEQSGEWLLFDTPLHFLNNVNDKKLSPSHGTEKVYLKADNGNSALTKFNNSAAALKIDVVFPIFHGTNGEDGTVQGLLELANLPYIGSGVLGSALCMDKDFTKRILRDAQIPIADFVTVHQYQVAQLNEQAIIAKIGLPCFVKPANSGSSVGISKVKRAEDLMAAIQLALQFDDKVLVEQFIKGREIECAVLGNEYPEASALGEIVPHHEFYNYEAKYLDPQGADLIIPANLPSAVIDQIQTIAKKAFQALNCAGMARIDFFVTANNEIYLNEVNTIPGFTQISMYPKLWMAAGLSYSQLLDKLIQLALEKFKMHSSLISARIAYKG